MEKEDIIGRLNELRASSRELDIPEAERTALMDQVAAFANTFINGLDNVKGFRTKAIGDLSIQGYKIPLQELLTRYRAEVAETGINAASPKHLGYIPGGGVFTAALADLLAAVTNPFASVHFASPGAATIENEVIAWLRSVFGFPDDAVGCLSSG
ncbi:MAG TPA: hypothetical protein PKG57_15285, partial [Flavobacteriales bacterium]|nr:hypothetical protein [Flavobacteriales bacterium]